VQAETLGAPGRADPGDKRELLAIRGLGIEVAATGTSLVRGFDLTVASGEVHGLVGETGAGKSLTAWSVLGLLPAGVRRAAGSITLGGTDLTTCGEDELRAIRGRQVAMIVQNPRTALVPTMTVGDQLALVHRARTGSSRKQSRAAATDALAAVRLQDPARRCRDYPHQLSGGQAQRVVIAMALLNRPRLVIADEATTGLDVTVQAEVLDLLMEQVAEVGAALLLITHDLGVVANYADTTTAMFAGEVVERGSTRALFEGPAHPYVRGLLAAADLDSRPLQRSRRTVSGAPPDLAVRPPGCQFAFRCPWQAQACQSPLPLTVIGPGHDARCARTAQLDELETEQAGREA
jgi:oligopeptide/dipeptide ABC transporter ATP-binding protein